MGYKRVTRGKVNIGSGSLALSAATTISGATTISAATTISGATSITAATTISAPFTVVAGTTVTYDPTGLDDGEGETKAVAVTGAAFGDYVLVSAPYDLVDLTVTGYVQAAGTVEIRVQNESGSSVNLASGTWKIKVLR